jgi:hypothetical protein
MLKSLAFSVLLAIPLPAVALDAATLKSGVDACNGPPPRWHYEGSGPVSGRQKVGDPGFEGCTALLAESAESARAATAAEGAKQALINDLAQKLKAGQ